MILIKFDEVVNMNVILMIFGLAIGLFGIINSVFNFLGLNDKITFMWLCIFQMWNLIFIADLMVG